MRFDLVGSQRWDRGALTGSFYLLWPWVVGRSRHALRAILLFLGGYLIIKGALAVTGHGYATCSNAFPFGSLAIGGIFGWLKFEGYLDRAWQGHRGLQWAVVIASAVLVGAAVRIPFLTYEVHAAVFGALLVVATHPRSVLNLEQPLLRRLGDISYGLYMLHPLCVYVVLRGLSNLGLDSGLVVYPSCLLLTVVVAEFSYRALEAPFLRLKRRGWSRIETNHPNAIPTSQEPARQDQD